MKKTLLLFAILITAVFGVYAQDYTPTPAISAGFSVGATIGPHSGEFPVATGVHLKLELPIADQLSFMGTVGYTGYISGNGYSTGYDSDYGDYSSGELVNFIPVTVGLRYYAVNKLFVQGDVGESFNLNSGNYYTAKKAAILVSPSVGYAVGFGSTRMGLDLSVAYDARLESAGDHNSSGYNVGSYNSLVFRLAFRYGL
jgi:hypothetical protein